MSSPSTIHGIPTPAGGDDNDSVAAIAAVIAALEGGSIIRRLSQAQIDALTGPQKPAGVEIYNITANVLQVSDGSAFRSIPRALYAIWTATTQSLSAGVWTALTQTAEDDPEGCLSGGVFTAPSTGMYRVDGYCRVDSAGGVANDVFVLRVLHNGSTEIAAQSSSTPNTAVDHYLSVSALVPLAASDTVRLSAYNGAAAARSTVESRMSVTRSA